MNKKLCPELIRKNTLLKRNGYFGNISLIIFNRIHPIVLQIRTFDKILPILQFSFQYYIGNIFESQIYRLNKINRQINRDRLN